MIEDYRGWLDAQVELARREADQAMTSAEIEAITGSGVEPHQERK